MENNRATAAASATESSGQMHKKKKRQIKYKSSEWNNKNTKKGKRRFILASPLITLRTFKVLRIEGGD